MTSEEGKRRLKQGLDGRCLVAVNQEQDDVIIGLYLHVIMGNKHFFVAHHRADGRAGRQRDLSDSLANHLRTAFVAVGNRFHRFGRAASQRMYLDHVPLAYVHQDAPERCLLG